VFACAQRTGAAVRESLRQDSPGGSRRLCSTLAAAPVLLAHAEVTETQIGRIISPTPGTNHRHGRRAETSDRRRASAEQSTTASLAFRAASTRIIVIVVQTQSNHLNQQAAIACTLSFQCVSLVAHDHGNHSWETSVQQQQALGSSAACLSMG
jgi:hypothetical protein